MKSTYATITAAALVVLGLSACTITLDDPTAGPGDSAPVDTAPIDATPEAPSPTPAAPAPTAPAASEVPTETPAPAAPPALPDGATWLYNVPSVSNEASGDQTSTVMLGGDGIVYPNSTTQWLGCGGATASTTYDLGGAYEQVRGRLALREGTPADVVAEVYIESDQGMFGGHRLEGDGGVPVQLLVEGSSTLTITTTTVEGTCAVDSLGYLSFVDTWVK